MNKNSLWLWVGLRMTLLAVSAVAIIISSMFLYFFYSDYRIMQRMSAEDLSIFTNAKLDIPHNQKILWEMLERYYDISEFLPGLGNNADWLALYSFVIIVIPIIIIVGIWLTHPLSKQFRSITKAARQVAAGRLDTRVVTQLHLPKEMQQLCIDFNRMIEKLSLYEREVAESSSNLAHELRTPLNAALGRVQGMLDDVFPLNENQLKLVKSQLHNLNTLINDLHFLSLAHAGRLLLDITEFSLSQLIEERLNWFTPQLSSEKMLSTTLLKGPLTVQADRSRLGQLINILIENAIKYASDGRLLHISAYQEDPFIKIEFLDHGQAVAQHDLENMFVRFWRAEQSRARITGGGGLGLSIAQAICEAHGGKILAQRRAEGGLSLIASLPAAPLPSSSQRHLPPIHRF